MRGCIRIPDIIAHVFSVIFSIYWEDDIYHILLMEIYYTCNHLTMYWWSIFV